MTGAEEAVRAAVGDALRGHAALAGLNGVFDGPAVRATPPFAEVREVLSVDWGTKDARGRELRVAVALRDAGEEPGRVSALAEAAGQAVEGLARDLDGWRVASVAFLRSRVAGEAPGRWLAVVEYRVRVLAAASAP